MRTALVVSVALLSLSRAASAQPRGLNTVRWLSACWEASSPNRRIVERWLAPVGDEVKGDSRTIAGTREIEGERLRILARGDTLVYDAHPSGQARTLFHAVGATTDSVAFLNPEHDFPQRITYRMQGTDSLVVRIEGDRAGRRQPVTFGFRRIDCAGVAEAPSAADETTLRSRYAELGAMLDETPLGLNNWFAKSGGPDFTYVFWATAGFRPPIVTREQVDRTAAQPPQSQASSTITDRSNVVTVERVLIRGDTSEVFVVLAMTQKFVDAQGRFGPANERRARVVEQRRLDRWTRRDGTWVLSTAALVGEDVFVEGRLIQRDGRSVGPGVR